MVFLLKLTIFLSLVILAMSQATTLYRHEFVVGAGIQIASLSDFHMLSAHILTFKGRNKPRAFVYAHNAARAAVGVPPLVWNATLAAYAQNYANRRAADCAMQHSGGPYGENLASGSWNLVARDAVSMWLSEKKFYGSDPSGCMDSGECLHYTQMVWNSTTSVGCARALCVNGWTFVTCNYYPPGNYIGEMPF